MNHTFLDYYRCPEELAKFALRELSSYDCGYFQFGPGALCYGSYSSESGTKNAISAVHDALEDVLIEGGTLWLPFDPSEIAANLRYERYPLKNRTGKRLASSSILSNAYYALRPILSVSVRKHLQKMWLKDWEEIPFPKWPVDFNVECIFERLMTLLLQVHAVDRVPFIWFWPDAFPSCAIMTHDVEGPSGRQSCSRLMDLDDAWGIKSSFEIVPEGRYSVTDGFLNEIRNRGFEINVHDFDHDGRLFSNRELFSERVVQINQYGKDYRAAGFRSAVLYRNADWFEALDFAYDMSVPSVANLEAQRGGCCSVTPFFIGEILELPVTTTQDYALFHILNQYSIDLWKRQTELISAKHGLASFIVHPDYIFEQRALATYQTLLSYLGELRSEGTIWIARPGEVNDWWRQRGQMTLARRGDSWAIEGPGSERARVAYASLEEGEIVYRVESCVASNKTVNAA
jgi:hypothetical protein